MELAEKLFGKRFEVLVATHVTSRCMHNHLLINTVSFVDGKKFCNYKSDYKYIRDVSDDICYEHGLSVLDGYPIHTAGNKNEVWMKKSGKVTKRDMVIKDVEYCLKYSGGYQDFYEQLKGIGYSFDYSRMSIKAAGWEWAKRLKTLGFTREDIEDRLYANADNPSFYSIEWQTHPPYKPTKSPLTDLMEELDFTVEHAKSPEKVFIAALFYIIVSLLELAISTTDYFIRSNELRHEAKDLKQFVSDYHFMKNNNIRTLADLSTDIEQTKEQISSLEKQRGNYDNKRRRAKTPEDIQLYKDKRKDITKKIEPLRKRLKQVEKIWDKSPHLFELVRQEYSLENGARERNKIENGVDKI